MSENKWEWVFWIIVVLMVGAWIIHADHVSHIERLSGCPVQVEKEEE